MAAAKTYAAGITSIQAPATAALAMPAMDAPIRTFAIACARSRSGYIPCMSAVYAATFATVMTKKTTVVAASMSGVAATRTPAMSTTRARVVVPATTRATGMPDRRYANTGARRWPMKGAATTSATSPALPPRRRTTTGMKVTSTEM